MLLKPAEAGFVCIAPGLQPEGEWYEKIILETTQKLIASNKESICVDVTA